MGSEGSRRRADRELVRRGLVASREEAQRVIGERRVQVDGAPVRKPSTLVLPGQRLLVGGPPPRFVSRGGEKLQGAIDRFGLDLRGCVVLDAGISTGGFADCALQAGSARVIGIDVGYGQLAERLRRDPRVELHERTNVRSVSLEAIGGSAVDVLVADLSFISLTTVLPVLLPLVRPDGHAIVLVKPQFEVGRERIGRGGIVRGAEPWILALERVVDAVERLGWSLEAVAPSPITGAAGNVEFVALLRPCAPCSAAPGVAGRGSDGARSYGSGDGADGGRAALIRAAVEEVEARIAAVGRLDPEDDEPAEDAAAQHGSVVASHVVASQVEADR